MVWILKLWAMLPLGFIQMVGKVLGLLVYYLSPRYSQRVQEHATQAGFVDSAFHKEAARQIGAMFAEIPKVWFDSKNCLDKTRVANSEYLIQLRDHSEQPIIFITPHLGCFEICARYLAQQKPITVMYRKARREFFDPVMKSARDDSDLVSVPADFSGVREFIKTLRQGGDIGLLPDQVPATSDGEWVFFFNRMAYTITLPGKLVSLTNARIVMVAGVRLAGGQGWELVFKDGPSLAGLTSREQAQAMNHALEELIYLAPTQYLWSYNRYKVPKFAPPMPH